MHAFELLQCNLKYLASRWTDQSFHLDSSGCLLLLICPCRVSRHSSNLPTSSFSFYKLGSINIFWLSFLVWWCRHVGSSCFQHREHKEESNVCISGSLQQHPQYSVQQWSGIFPTIVQHVTLWSLAQRLAQGHFSRTESCKHRDLIPVPPAGGFSFLTLQTTSNMTHSDETMTVTNILVLI